MWRVGNDVIEEVMQHKFQSVTFIRTMGLGLGLHLNISQSTNETKTLKVIWKMLTRPPQKVVEPLCVGGVTHVTLRNSSTALLASSRILGSKDILRSYTTKESKEVNGCLMFTVQPPIV
jgi:hypothetical protein